MVAPWRMAQMLATLLSPATCQVCRHASRNTLGWVSQKYSDSHPKQRQQKDMFEQEDMDAVEAKLKSIVNEERRRQKAAKFHKIKRQMNKPGAPERILSWEAIEQIRYLKQESPDEWTIQKLAEGFSVSSDVISRVLRSKFTPTTERKLQQDSKVLPSIGQLSFRDDKAGQSRLPLPKNATPAILTSGNTGALTTLSNGALSVKEGETGLMPSGGNVPSVSRVTSQLSATQKLTPILQEKPDSLQKTTEMDVRDDTELEDEWDGVILTEEDLEQIMQTLQEKPSPVEQKGQEFFDSDGNFLYRI
ncbi:neugrin-like [Myxocyprinus asiaticus]|uniref:neugrin-like n=1 Tax=Myxocyprinus asiaticus TaxID=70543 RepID=UPI00222202BF|nr:neugrin-like [Myxocyprinus asiaticus]XP_051524712.1 neugrin-like [Myxocyprinus asiaticus]